jgi:hypothetical protein
MYTSLERTQLKTITPEVGQPGADPARSHALSADRTARVAN